jgi:hypothetical protein
MKNQMPGLAVAVFFLMLAVSGCTTQKSWVYQPNAYAVAGSGMPLSTKEVVILPFDDARENLNENRLGFAYIPLFPYGWCDFRVPEGEAQHVGSGLWVNYRPTEDFPKALAQELMAAGVFKEAYFDFKKGTADWVIRGKILNTHYEGTSISYCLSVYGGYLWFLGFPCGTVANELEVEIALGDAKTGTRLFSKSYAAQPYSAVAWIYDMPNDFNYPEMLQEAYKAFVKDLKKALPGIEAATAAGASP